MTKRHTALRTILLIEDDENHAEIVRRSVSSKWELEHLSNAGDAIRRLTQACDGDGSLGVPDLILLDWRFQDQELQGRDVLEHLKKHHDATSRNLHRLPIVILTTSDDENDICAAFSVYANSYLVKPKPGDINAWGNLFKEVDHYWHTLDQHMMAKPRPGRLSEI